jgi:hypothetical protein
MILEQKIDITDKKNIRLRNRIDCSAAIKMAGEASEKGGRCPTSDTVMPLGFIPPEMWQFNPWLMEADKARCNGDMKTYNENVLKFFKLFPQFAVLHTQKYYTMR